MCGSVYAVKNGIMRMKSGGGVNSAQRYDCMIKKSGALIISVLTLWGLSVLYLAGNILSVWSMSVSLYIKF